MGQDKKWNGELRINDITMKEIRVLQRKKINSIFSTWKYLQFLKIESLDYCLLQ